MVKAKNQLPSFYPMEIFLHKSTYEGVSLLALAKLNYILRIASTVGLVEYKGAMLRVYHLLIGAIVLLLSPMIFKSVFKKPAPKSQSQPQQVSTPQAVATLSQATPVVTTKPIESNIWTRLLGNISAPPGWNVAPCEGNAPLLCIASLGKNLGSVQMQVYPREKLPQFENMLVTAGIPMGVKVDYQNPNNQIKIVSALNAWITDSYVKLFKDRQTSYANNITFTTFPPQQVNIGRLQGLRYGFAGINKVGGIQEQHLAYVAFDGNALYVINTALDPKAKSGTFEKLENLALFEPFLSAIAVNLKLPN